MVLTLSLFVGALASKFCQRSRQTNVSSILKLRRARERGLLMQQNTNGSKFDQ